MRQELKSATRAAHERAEARWTHGGVFPSRAGYDAWLRRMAEVHVGLGFAASLRAGWSEGSTVEEARSLALRQDLTGRDMPDAAAATLSHDAAWGALYALNGSALGAGVLLRSGLAAKGWPVGYLTEMANFAKSGALGGFFRALETEELSFEAATHGALKVFEAIAAEPALNS